MDKETKFDQLWKEWEELDQRIGQASGFSDAQLEELYERASHMSPVSLPALPPPRYPITIVPVLYLAAIVLLLVLPVPHADALPSPDEYAASVKIVENMVSNMAVI
jgi:hypothetical protein